MAMTGGCLCGAVRYSFEGSPMFAAKCYCSDCRRTAGSGHGAVYGGPAASVALSGETRAFTKRSDHESDVTRVFCPTCGAPLYSESSNMPGVYIMKIGSLDDPNAVAPQIAVYASSAPVWDAPPTGMPSFPQMPPRG